MRKQLNGSYTVEAAIYIPIILFMLFQSINIGIDFWQNSRERTVCTQLQELDSVKDFYGYQILDDVGREILDD